jgi:hypothetical protein
MTAGCAGEVSLRALNARRCVFRHIAFRTLLSCDLLLIFVLTFAPNYMLNNLERREPQHSGRRPATTHTARIDAGVTGNEMQTLVVLVLLCECECAYGSHILQFRRARRGSTTFVSSQVFQRSKMISCRKTNGHSVNPYRS